MRETELSFLTDEVGETIMSEANIAFLTEDFIAHHDIRKLAEKIADYIKRRASGTDSRTIIEAFSIFDIVYRYDFQSDIIHSDLAPTDPAQEFKIEFRFCKPDAPEDDFVTVSITEMKAALERLRQALILELATMLDSDTYHVLTEVIKKGVFNAHDDRLIKFMGSWHREQKKEHFMAMRRLYGLPEPSPNILYTVLAKSRRHDVEILRRMNITNLEEFIKQKPRPPLRDTIRYFTDNVRGLHFLIQHGFVHSDHSLDNMGIDLDNDRGALFDLDGLLDKEHYITGYACKTKYAPPEMKEGNASPGPFGTPQMAYEVGYGLREISDTYQLEQTDWSDSDPEREIQNLAMALTLLDPDNRPDFSQIIQRLDAIISRQS